MCKENCSVGLEMRLAEAQAKKLHAEERKTLTCTYRVAQNKIPHGRICNISATSGLILKILEAA